MERTSYLVGNTHAKIGNMSSRIRLTFQKCTGSGKMGQETEAEGDTKKWKDILCF